MEDEPLVRTSLVAVIGQLAMGKKDTVWVGIGYKMWNNKCGNGGIDVDVHALIFQAKRHF